MCDDAERLREVSTLQFNGAITRLKHTGKPSQTAHPITSSRRCQRWRSLGASHGSIPQLHR